mgnify:CR=1 FL=1
MYMCENTEFNVVVVIRAHLNHNAFGFSMREWLGRRNHLNYCPDL